MKCNLEIRAKIKGRKPPFSILYPLRKGFMMRESMRAIKKTYFPDIKTGFLIRYKWMKPKKNSFTWATITVEHRSYHDPELKLELIPKITFNSVLLNRFIPEWVVQYVIYHEFCHIALEDYEQKHSPEFEIHLNKFSWKPDAEDWIAENGKLIAVIHQEMKKVDLSTLDLQENVPLSVGATAHGS